MVWYLAFVFAFFLKVLSHVDVMVNDTQIRMHMMMKAIGINEIMILEAANGVTSVDAASKRRGSGKNK